ncbi:MAG: lipocalin family protein, partial [Psychroflexus sp.]|nr:lipocalin family protein [Psychroflexus sp.]
FKSLSILTLLNICLLSCTFSYAQELKGKWILSKKNSRQVVVIEFTKDSLINYTFDKHQVTIGYEVSDDRITVDPGSIPLDGKYEFVNDNRLRLTPDRGKSSIDFVKLKPTKTKLNASEVKNISYKVVYQGRMIDVQFDKLNADINQKIRLDQIDSTYFLSFFRNGKRLGAMPIDQINAEKIVIYGFPEEPYMVSGKSYKGKTYPNNKPSESTENLPVEEKIIGQWFYRQIEGRSSLSNCTKKTFIQFRNDQALIIKPFAENRSNGDCIEGTSLNGTYEVLENNQIKVFQNGKSEIWKIQALTKTELVVEKNDRILTLTKE